MSSRIVEWLDGKTTGDALADLRRSKRTTSIVGSAGIAVMLFSLAPGVSYLLKRNALPVPSEYTAALDVRNHAHALRWKEGMPVYLSDISDKFGIGVAVPRRDIDALVDAANTIAVRLESTPQYVEYVAAQGALDAGHSRVLPFYMVGVLLGGFVGVTASARLAQVSHFERLLILQQPGRSQE